MLKYLEILSWRRCTQGPIGLNYDLLKLGMHRPTLAFDEMHGSMKKQNTCHRKIDLPQFGYVKSDDVDSLIPNTKYIFIAIGNKNNYTDSS